MKLDEIDDRLDAASVIVHAIVAAAVKQSPSVSPSPSDAVGLGIEEPPEFKIVTPFDWQPKMEADDAPFEEPYDRFMSNTVPCAPSTFRKGDRVRMLDQRR